MMDRQSAALVWCLSALVVVSGAAIVVYERNVPLFAVAGWALMVWGSVLPLMPAYRRWREKRLRREAEARRRREALAAAEEQQHREARAAAAKRRREAQEESAAKEARRVRPCETMDRATLVDHVAEFAVGRSRPGSQVLVGMDTASLRDLCTAIRERRPWSGLLAGEVHPFSVYRIEFADGTAYVGQTGKYVVERVAQHVTGAGSAAVFKSCKAGVPYRFQVLASGLHGYHALQLERKEIMNLRRPLNVAIPAPLPLIPPRAGVDRTYQSPLELE